MQKDNRIEQVKLFQECDNIRESIENQYAERKRLGFSREREFAVYKTLDAGINNSKNALHLTRSIFQELADELAITGWQEMSQVQKTMRRKIKENLEGKVPDQKRQQLAVDLLAVIKQNS